MSRGIAESQSTLICESCLPNRTEKEREEQFFAADEATKCASFVCALLYQVSFHRPPCFLTTSPFMLPSCAHCKFLFLLCSRFSLLLTQTRHQSTMADPHTAPHLSDDSDNNPECNDSLAPKVRRLNPLSPYSSTSTDISSHGTPLKPSQRSEGPLNLMNLKQFNINCRMTYIH